MSLIHPRRATTQQALVPSRMLSAKRSIVEHGIESRTRGTLGWLKIRRTSSTAFNRKGQLPWVGYRVFRYGSSASRRADHTRRNGTPGPNALRISTDTLYSRHGATICLCLRIKGAFTACNSLTSKAHPPWRTPSPYQSRIHALFSFGQHELPPRRTRAQLLLCSCFP